MVLAGSEHRVSGESPRNRPHVSVVIPTRNRPESLRAAVAATLGGSRADCEILVMDQSDGDETREVVEQFAERRLRYTRVPRLGANPSRNLGAALARSPVVAFLDDDCCPRPDWLAQIDAAFASDPSLQFIFGQLKAPPCDSSIGACPEFLPSKEWQAQRGKRRIVMVAAGANMAARKTFLHQIGGFDEIFGTAAPDISDCSISYKVLRSGAKWVASPEIEVIHTNGFRTHEALGKIYTSYARELGFTYGRFVRRGDSYALWCFIAEQAEMAWGIAKSTATSGRPRGARQLLAHARAFASALRVAPMDGYVTGHVIAQMEREARLLP